MPKVFRIHTGANNNVIDWQKGTGITSRAIQDIKDPEGSKASREITSIPSPFARIDLVRQAFQQVANGELEGKSIFHKMVSDTLDVAEIFFNIDKFGDKFEILICRRADIEALMRSQHWGHKALGRTLALYLEQDTKAYNFDRWNDIYLLRYKGPEAEKFEIVGATSPRTLFFTTANDLSHIARHVSFGEDRPFDGDYAPLFKRDPMFVAALWAMSVRDADFCTRFGDLHRYIEACYTHFDAKTRALIEEAETGPAAFLERHCRNIEVGGSQLEVLGMHFPRRSESASAVQHDFAIKRTVGEDKVLVLPTEAGTTYTKLQYVAKAWHSEARAPYFDERPLDQRVLPEEGTKFPYLTISDLLAPEIVQLPLGFNAEQYFDGRLVSTTEEMRMAFLLPVTKRFFDYFTVADLQGYVGRRQEPMIEMRVSFKRVEVTLRVPIEGSKIHTDAPDHIVYKRSYDLGKVSQVTTATNQGAITPEQLLSVGIFPAVRIPATFAPSYRVALLDFAGGAPIVARYFEGATEVQPTNIVERSAKRGDHWGVHTHVLESHFDRILLNVGGVEGFLVPILAKGDGNKEYQFAVDFGTSNTHIEYREEGKPERAFDIAPERAVVAALYPEETPRCQVSFVRKAQRYMAELLLPRAIGPDHQAYAFPIRTALGVSKNYDDKRPAAVMGDVNVAHGYERVDLMGISNIKTDLKWGVKQDVYLKAYIECIVLAIRAKVLVEGGDLARCKIKWFYPTSMSRNQFNVLEKVWNEQFDKYFNKENRQKNLSHMSEAEAPYYYFSNREGAATRSVSIDIGGGTTDVVMTLGGKPVLLTSFRMAGNSLWGDGVLEGASHLNGYVQRYHQHFLDVLQANNLDSAREGLIKVAERQRSEDIISYYFSLKKVAPNNPQLDFAELLAEEEVLKYTVILFYGAIFYHIALLMKASDLPLPLSITFSGNGSRSLDILTSSNYTLADFARRIFERVYNKGYESNEKLIVIRDGAPKESTCKGGVMGKEGLTPDEVSNICKVLRGTDTTTIVSGNMAGDVMSLFPAVQKQIEEFLGQILGFRAKWFSDSFGASASDATLNSIEQIFKSNLREKFEKAISRRQEEAGSDTDFEINDSLFFLPFAASLFELAKELNNMRPR